MKVWAPIGLVMPKVDADQPDGGAGLSIVPFINLPTGRPGRFLGDGGFGGGGVLAGSYLYKDFLVAAHFGVEYAPDAAFANLRGGTRLLSAIAMAYDIRDTVAIPGEVTFDPSLVNNRVAFTGSPGEFLLSARGNAGYGVNWTVGASTAITRGASAATFRAFLGIGWTYGKDARFRDTDSDGLVDAYDACIEEPETYNDFLDDDGCPEPAGNLVFKVVDGDGDPITGITATIAGGRLGPTDKQGYLDTGEWPVGLRLDAQFDRMMEWYAPKRVRRVQIAEGTTEVEVEMPILPGLVHVSATANGEPVDAEMTFQGWKEVPVGRLGGGGQAVFHLGPGKWQAFARAKGFATEQFVIDLAPNEAKIVDISLELDEATIVFKDDQFVTLEPVHFEYDKAVIQDDSKPMLRELAANLTSYEDISLVEVQGHTDSDGSNSYNVRLSQQRVDAVRDFLIEEGVLVDKLVARGFGESCPADTNATEEGRANNRRVQFFVVKPEPPHTIPCHEGAPGMLSSVSVQVTGDEAGASALEGDKPAEDAAPVEDAAPAETPEAPAETPAPEEAPASDPVDPPADPAATGEDPSDLLP
jgi:outer membrane protein OmpA-like peptidoglycan-associated protein